MDRPDQPSSEPPSGAPSGETAEGPSLAGRRADAARRVAAWRSDLESRVQALDERLDEIGGSGPSRERPTRPSGDSIERQPNPPADQRRPTSTPRRLAEADRPSPAAAPSPLALLGTLGVAVAFVTLAVSDGGIEPDVFAAATVAVWWAVGMAIVAGAWRGAVPLGMAAAAACLAGYALLTFASTSWSTDDGLAVADGVRELGYLGVLVLAAIASRAGGTRPILAGIALGAVAIAALAVLARLEPGLIGTEPDTGGRLAYPIGYWNGLAACLAIGVGVLAWFGSAAQRPAWRSAATAILPLPLFAIYLTASRGGALAAVVGLGVLFAASRARWRILAVALLGGLATVPALLFARNAPDLVNGLDTRAAESAGHTLLVLLPLSILVLAALALWQDRRLARLRRPSGPVLVLAGVGTALLIALAALVILGGEGRSERLSSAKAEGTTVAGGSIGRTLDTRTPYWETAFDAFRESPAVGIGAGEFESYWNSDPPIPALVRHVHSLFFESLAELGLAGLLLILGFLGTVALVAVRTLWSARRRAREPAEATVGSYARETAAVALAMLAAAVASATLDWSWEIPAVFAPALVAAGIIVAGGGRGAAGGRARAPSGAGPGWAAVGIACAAAGTVAGGVLFVSELRLADSRQAAGRGDLRVAAAEARGAADLTPWAAEPHSQLAFVEEEAKDLPGAREALEDAIERAPEDWTLWLRYARVQYRLGDRAQADAALAEARRLAPFFTRGFIERDQSAFIEGRLLGPYVAGGLKRRGGRTRGGS